MDALESQDENRKNFCTLNYFCLKLYNSDWIFTSSASISAEPSAENHAFATLLVKVHKKRRNIFTLWQFPAAAVSWQLAHRMRVQLSLEIVQTPRFRC